MEACGRPGTPSAMRRPGFGVAPRQRLTLVLAVAAMLAVGAVMALVVTRPGAVEAQAQFQVWRSPQFGMAFSYPNTWEVVEQRIDLERGDVVILGNETSALLVGLLHDTRTPRQMAEELVQTQKEATPDLAVVQQEETLAGSVLMFLQYTIHPHTDAAMLIDEKALVGALEPGVSTITLRGMVPDRASLETEFEQIESIISTLAPDR